jgi:GNAT superfamily N-acetyltransferase
MFWPFPEMKAHEGHMGTFALRDVWMRKIWRNFEDQGLSAVMRKIIAFVLSPVYEERTYRLYNINLRAYSPQHPSEFEEIEFRLLSPSDTEAIREIEHMSEWLHGTLFERIGNGAICLAAIENGRVAGFNLISFGDVFMPLIHSNRRFRRDEAWSEQIAVSKDSRKRGLGAALRYRIFEELRKRGYRKLYGGALVDNTPSLKLARRVGFREFVDIQYTRVLGQSKWIYTRVS